MERRFRSLIVYAVVRLARIYQSQADKTMMYVFEKDEVAVITPDVAIRIPVDLFREIADIADDYNDLKRRRIV